MRTLWLYIQGKDNREILTFVCGGLAAVVTASWVAYTHFSKKESSDKPQTTISAQGGVAAGSITGGQITINPQAQSPGPNGSAAAVPR